jgi:NAD(P)-dependent dehydrogenase (short-subunit alcohol dehydrogenase family)
LAIARELLAAGARKVYAGMRAPLDLGIAGLVPVRLDVTDSASVAAAAALCADTDILINNAGILHTISNTLDPSGVDTVRGVFETNYFGPIRVSQAFASVLAANGGGAIVNVLSVGCWISRPALSAYSASKAAAWSFTNALRVDLKNQGTQVLALHVSFMDTDMTKNVTLPKSDPVHIAKATLNALENGVDELLADDFTRTVKQSLSTERPIYLDPPVR